MIRALVFVVSLGLMISSALLIGARNVAEIDNPANQPPSLQLNYDSYSSLTSPGEIREAALLTE